MSKVQSALYARVSTETQAKAHTIQGQVAGLLERAKADGCAIPLSYQFVDDGFSGSTLIRPALERLRDQVAAGNVDRLYVISPDRLARKLTFQAVLLEEFGRLGVELVFLNHSNGNSPLDELMLQVQGAYAEFERATIMERSRRGKRHAARNGSVNVLCRAPYGYKYIPKAMGDGVARLEINPEQAEVVRHLFEWVGCDRLSLRDAAHRLTAMETPSPKGYSRWIGNTIRQILCNPAYAGRAAFGKTRTGPPKARLRPAFGQPEQPRRTGSTYQTPEEEWLIIPVTPLVSQEVFDAAQEQLQENRRRARARKNAPPHLLQGLLVCKRCGHAYVRTATRTTRNGETSRQYNYLRCMGNYHRRAGGISPMPPCGNRAIELAALEEAVWNEVKGLLNNPARLRAEYELRLSGAETQGKEELAPLEREERRLRNALERLIDGLTEGLVEKKEFEPRAKALRQRLASLEGQERQLREASLVQEEIQFLVGQFQAFAEKVRTGLDAAEFSTRQSLIRTLIKRVEIDDSDINIVFRVDTRPPPAGGPSDFLQHCPWRTDDR